MEVRLNLLFLGVLGAATAGLTASDPYAAIDPIAGQARRLSILEDDFAREPESEIALLSLMDAYLERSRPELVLAAASRVERAEGEEQRPEVMHRLSRAYESLGRFEDAALAAKGSFERCRAMPDDACASSRLVVFDIHRNALSRIVSMGIFDPGDSRIRAAYDGAMRRVDVRASGG